MPYTPSTVPDNVPKKYAAQFSEVWNSAYAAAIADKKSPAQAEETAFAQAHGVILKAKQKDDRAITLQDGPGFGRDSSGGGQVADPTQSMRYSEDQPRDEHGKFGSGSHTDQAEAHAAAAHTHEQKAREAKDAGRMKESAAHSKAAANHFDAGDAHTKAIGGTATDNKIADLYSSIAVSSSKIAEASKGQVHNDF